MQIILDGCTGSLGDYPSALDFHLLALHFYEELDNELGIASSLINSGVAYRNLGEKI